MVIARAEAIRRAAKKIAVGRDTPLDLGQNVKSDAGFKALRLDSSNFKVWEGNATPDSEVGKQIDMHIDHPSKASTPEDVLCFGTEVGTPFR